MSMYIETKFSIGDWVWVSRFDGQMLARVQDIEVFVYGPDTYRVQYGLQLPGVTVRTPFVEGDLFAKWDEGEATAEHERRKGLRAKKEEEES